MTIVDLRRSVELENRADLLAAACNFGEASALMREANKLRERQFGKLSPNELRELTASAIEAATAGETAQTGSTEGESAVAKPDARTEAP